MKTRADLSTLPGFAGLGRDTHGNPCVWENVYRCNICTSEMVEWTDTWSCVCNDRCPTCDAETEPDESIWIGPEGPLSALWDALPDHDGKTTWKHADVRRRPSLSVYDLALIYSTLIWDNGLQGDLKTRIGKSLEELLDPEAMKVREAYRNAVQVRDGETEVDDDAEVSMGDDPGAYVMTWTWVTAEDAGLCRTCCTCGMVYDDPDVIDASGRCGDCADMT